MLVAIQDATNVSRDGGEGTAVREDVNAVSNFKTILHPTDFSSSASEVLQIDSYSWLAQ